LNRYVEEKAPWKLAKEPDAKAELETVLRSLAEGLRVVTVLLTPYIPDSAEKLLNALGAPETDLHHAGYGSHPGGQPVEKLAPLFPKPE
jgi:methionyl-tRNA synthetase